MAIAFVKDASGTDAFGSSIATTVPAGGFAAGNHLILAFSCADGSFNVSSVADSASNSYTVHSGTRQVQGGTAVVIASAALTSSLTSGQTITSTLAGATGGAVIVSEFSGLNTTSWFDQVAKASIAFDTAFTSGNTPTTTQADELLFGLNFANSTARSFTPTGGFTELQDTVFFSWKAQTQYLVVSAAGAYASTSTADTATAGIAVLATFKAAAAGGTTFTLAPQNISPLRA